jgi:tetratricopeptide (TPR) repeat protein
MRIGIIILVLLFISGCALQQKSDRQTGDQIAYHMNKGNYSKAYNIYSGLSEKEKNGKTVKKKFKQLQAKITKIKETTEQAADQAIEKGDWKKAIDVYKKQEALIEVDAVFKESYNRFVKRHEREKKEANNDFLIVRADYLIKTLQIKQSSHKVDPYDSEIEDQIDDIKEESVSISRQLLELGTKAIHDNDISTARKLIPLAKQLDDNKEVTRASKVLEKITKPLDKYIVRLTEKGTRLYSDEEYKKALEVWNDVLYLDPNNKKVQANRERTNKVLESLEKIKQENVIERQQISDSKSKDLTP